MEIKDVKIGDKVQIRKDIPEEELTEILGSHGLPVGKVFELQRRGEVTVRGLQYRDLDNDWDSVTLKEMNFYWPIELFELSKKSKEEQVQEDILALEGIAERYGIQYSMKGIVEWLRDFGQKYLPGD